MQTHRDKEPDNTTPEEGKQDKSDADDNSAMPAINLTPRAATLPPANHRATRPAEGTASLSDKVAHLPTHRAEEPEATYSEEGKEEEIDPDDDRKMPEVEHPHSPPSHPSSNNVPTPVEETTPAVENTTATAGMTLTPPVASTVFDPTAEVTEWLNIMLPLNVKSSRTLIITQHLERSRMQL